MPAVSDFPFQTNPSSLLAGLVLQEKSRIECNEFGLEQGTLKFFCLNDRFKNFRPARGMKVSEFTAGDDDTKRILLALDYVGAQTRGFTPDGEAPDIGLLEVMVQGAIFDADSSKVSGVITPAGGDDPITLPLFESDGTQDTINFKIYETFGAGSGPGPTRTFESLPTYDVTVDYHTIDLSFEYMAKVRASRPRFLKASYDLAADGKSLIINSDASPLLLELLIDRAVGQQLFPTLGDAGNVDASLANPETAIADATWRPGVEYRGTGAVFKQTPAGQYFHVLETTSIKIFAKPPAIVIPTPP